MESRTAYAQQNQMQNTIFPLLTGFQHQSGGIGAVQTRNSAAIAILFNEDGGSFI